ncbi:hypothetical protein [Methylomonas sp. HYX-M1]|uniref:hypothetical protein n=1 Tax=Methylomonas sp. HYX-M1 TaxID=3139307 RepID=UPI00345B8DF9
MSNNFKHTLTALSLIAGIAQVGAAQAESVYYKAKLNLKTLIENPSDTENIKVLKVSQSQSSLVNIAQDKSPFEAIANTTILALRIDDCDTGTAQLVVYDTANTTEIVTVSDSFNLFINQVRTSKKGVYKTSQFFTTANFSASEGSSYSINSGELSIFGSAKLDATDGCPSKISATVTGAVNIGLLTQIEGQAVSVPTQIMISGASKLSAQRLD